MPAVDLCRHRARGPGNQIGPSSLYRDMSLTLLILFALGTVLPCIGLWAIDERARRRAATRAS
jgi:hypothetical protein